MGEEISGVEEEEWEEEEEGSGPDEVSDHTSTHDNKPTTKCLSLPWELTNTGPRLL